MMKIICVILFLLSGILGSYAQQISVKSFRKLGNDLSARTAQRPDQNGDVCAIVKVVTPEKGFYFDGDGNGIVAVEEKVGEYWLYLPYGSRRLTVKHEHLGILRDYAYGEHIDKACVYELVLVTGKVVTKVEEEIPGQWLVIHTDPKDAAVYLDDVYETGTDGTVQKFVASGKHSYRVEHPYYHGEAGQLEVKPDAKKERTVKLRPAFGGLSVISFPESGAEVYVDGERAGYTPYEMKRVKSGEHNVRVQLAMYQPQEKRVTVTDGEVVHASFTLAANYGEVVLSTVPDGEIWVNNERKGRESWSGRLNAGMYIVEVRQPSHRVMKRSLGVKAGEKIRLDLGEPEAISGALNLSTTPADAVFKLNGREMGTTPALLKNLLVGEYTLDVCKEGYAPLRQNITIEEGKVLALNLPLSSGRSITLRTEPRGGSLWLDGEAIGNSPRTLLLKYGEHILSVQQKGNKIEKKFRVDPDGVQEVVLSYFSRCGDNLVDGRDGQEYPTVQIGKQCWMAKNMNFASSGRYCYDDEPGFCRIYGGLYTWEEAMQGQNGENVQGICPQGWHIPTAGEVNVLVLYLGNSGTGWQNKSTSGWAGNGPYGQVNNGNGKNSSGLNALPGGFRMRKGEYFSRTFEGYWWTSTLKTREEPQCWCMLYSSASTDYRREHKDVAMSVRCLKNE